MGIGVGDILFRRGRFLRCRGVRRRWGGCLGGLWWRGEGLGYGACKREGNKGYERMVGDAAGLVVDWFNDETEIYDDTKFAEPAPAGAEETAGYCPLCLIIPCQLDQVLPPLFSLSPTPNVLDLKILAVLNLLSRGGNSQREGTRRRGRPPCC